MKHENCDDHLFAPHIFSKNENSLCRCRLCACESRVTCKSSNRGCELIVFNAIVFTFMCISPVSVCESNVCVCVCDCVCVGVCASICTCRYWNDVTRCTRVLVYIDIMMYTAIIHTRIPHCHQHHHTDTTTATATIAITIVVVNATTTTVTAASACASASAVIVATAFAISGYKFQMKTSCDSKAKAGWATQEFSE